MIQIADGNKVTTEMVFHFKDGSLYDEKTVFSQDRTFRLLSDHLIQKGPFFPHPIQSIEFVANILYERSMMRATETHFRMFGVCTFLMICVFLVPHSLTAESIAVQHQLAEMGEHQLTIRDYLRHSNLHVTNKYLQATSKTKRLAQNKLVDAILPTGFLPKTNLIQ
jgi:hypothetical protein